MLGSRLLVSAILIPSLIGLLYVDARIGPTAPVLYVMCLLIGVRCAWELMPLLRRPNVDSQFGPVAVCVTMLLTVVWGRHWVVQVDGLREIVWLVPSLGETFAVCVLLLMTVRAIRFREPGHHLPSLGAEVFAVAYIGVLLGLTAELRWASPPRGDYVLLGLLIVATKLGDVGAYTLGRLFGRRKMSPHLSPGKTWMGAVGAVLGGILGAILWMALLAGRVGPESSRIDLLPTILIGALLAVAGLMGDLCESLIKRDAGVKDSAQLMPGFGGLLDLVDSLLFAGPVLLLSLRFVGGLGH